MGDEQLSFQATVVCPTRLLKVNHAMRIRARLQGGDAEF
jgi:hypothetical protein